jgi:ankyrin repeat protein
MCVVLLVLNDANLNLRRIDGKTALDLAVMANKLNVSEFLQKKGVCAPAVSPNSNSGIKAPQS